MSLINNMLKDLEKRKTIDGRLPTIALLTRRPTRLLPAKIVILASAALSLSIVLLLSAILWPTPNHRLAPMLTVKNTIVSPLPEVNPVWFAPTSIMGVTLQVKDNITEITFLLDHAALYRLNSSDLSNQFSLVIEHAKMQSELPPVRYLKTAIQSMKMATGKDSTQFIFNLYPDSTIKYVNLNENDAKPELVVAIEQGSPHQDKPTEQTVRTEQGINDTPTAIKTPAMQSVLLEKYQSALTKAENGNYDTAINDLTALLDMEPAYKDARVSLAALLIDRGDNTRALAIINKGMEITPNHLPFVELKARLLSLAGKTDQAITLLQKEAPPLQENPEYHAFLAALYEQNNNDKLASRLYSQLTTLDPKNSNWWFGLGVSLDKLGQAKQAVLAYNKANAAGGLTMESNSFLQDRLRALREAIDDRE